MSSDLEAPPRPSVFAYLTYRLFLQDWLDWKRSVLPSYTYGIFARQSGLSRAVLPNVLEGRREPNDKTLDGFAKAMRLGADEREFLGLLVDLGRASSLDENAALLRRIFEHPRYAAGNIVDTEHLEAMTSWLSLTVLELAKLPDFRLDPGWLAARVRPEVSAEEVAEVIARLSESGLLDEEGRPQAHRLHTPPEVESIAAYRVHQSFLDAAKDALQQVPYDQRHYGLLSMRVPRSAVPDVLAEVQGFVERMRELAGRWRDDGDTGMQLNVQSWVLMEPTDEEEPS